MSAYGSGTRHRAIVAFKNKALVGNRLRDAAEMPGPASPGPLGLLRLKDFRRAWLVGVMTGSVRWSDMLVTGIYVFDVTASARDVAIVTFLRFLPMVGGAFSGAIAARLTIGRLLRLSLGMLAVVYSTLAILDWSGSLTIWQVGIGAFLNGVYWSTENSVRRTLLGEIAGPGRTSAAIGLDWATISAVRLVGPVGASAIYAGHGVGAAYAAFAICFALATILALKLEGRDEPSATRGLRLFSTVLEDIRIALQDRLMRGALVATISMNFFCFSYSSMIPVIGKDTLNAPPVLVGLLSTAESIGALVGALLVANFTRQRWFGPAFLAGSFATMAGALVFGLAGWYPMALAALAFAGVGSGIFATTQSTLILVNAPPERRSRTMGVLSTFIGLGQGGVLALGPAAAQLGAPHAVTAFQAIGIVLLVLCAIAWPRLWRAPEPS